MLNNTIGDTAGQNRGFFGAEDENQTHAGGATGWNSDDGHFSSGDANEMGPIHAMLDTDDDYYSTH